jgi:putative membrane protein
MFDSRTHRDEVWKGIAAGMAGGIVASYVMNEFQTVTKKLSEKSSPGKGKGEARKNEGEDATVKTAEAISDAVGHKLSRKEKKAAGPAVHYAFGATMGGVFGALAELSPKTAAVAGMPFGTALWLAADEVAVPALGLSKKPSESPASVHAYALASHLVYGVTTNVVRRLVRRVLD